MSRIPNSSNFTNEDINPCLDESKLTQKCLDRELYDYSKCAAYFQNYKNCKLFWGYVKSRRRQAGISPALPRKEEREKILKLKQQGIKVISVDE